MVYDVTSVRDNMRKVLKQTILWTGAALFLAAGAALPAYAAKDLDIRNDTNSFLFVSGANGNVGVNSAVPQTKLDVEGNVYLGGGNVGINTTGSRALLEVGTAAGVAAGSNAAAIIKNDLIVDGKIYGDGSNITGVPGSISSLTPTRLPVANSPDTLVDSVIYNVGNNVGIGTSDPTAVLHIRSGGFISGASATSPGAFKHNDTGFDATAWFGIYSSGNSTYYGISDTLPAPPGTSTLGGYYKGLGIGGSTTGGNNPIFGVLALTQSGNGLRNTALTVYDTNKVVTYYNTLDNGAGQAYFTDNVGIGTDVPRGLLEVDTGVYTTPFIVTSAGNVGVATVLPRTALEVDGVIYGTNIGINSTAPQASLDVDGLIYTHQSIGIATTGPRALLEVGNAASITAGSNAGAIIKNDLVVDGKIYGDASQLTNLPAGITGLTGAPAYGKIPRASSSTTLVDSAVYQDANGNVGIGTTAPVRQLDLTRSIELTDTVNDSTGVIYKNGVGFLHNYMDPTTWGDNLFLGKYAGNFSLSAGGGAAWLASDNVGLGNGALQDLTTGYSNIAVGSGALNRTQDGITNLAIGQGTMYWNISGGGNVALGAGALQYGTSASSNTAVGVLSLYNITTGFDNVALGEFTGQGSSGLSDVSRNVFLGTNVGKLILTGADNNLIAGYAAGDHVTTGAGNILLGYQAGNAITTGSNNILLGYDIDAQSNTGSNQLSIGNLIFATGGFGTGTTIGTGSVGIATTAPRGTLEVDGTTYLMSGNVGVGTTGPRALFEVGTAANVTAGSNAAAIIKNDLVVDGKIYGDGSSLTGVSGVISGLHDGYISRASSGTTIVDSGIYQNGSNIGIGTTNPGAQLNITEKVLLGATVLPAGPPGAGKLVISQDASQVGLSLTRTSSGAWSYFEAFNESGGSVFRLNEMGTLLIGLGMDVGIAKNAPGVLEINSGVVNQYRDLQLRSLMAAGNVGIGSEAPQQRLDVEGGVYFGNGNVGIGTSGARALLEVGTAANVTAGSNAAAIIKNDLVVDGKIYGDGSGLTSVPGSLSSLTATRVPVASGPNTLVDSVIYNVGNNVGIGTTGPTEALKVIGNFEVSDPTGNKAYRFRTNAGALDLDASGSAMFYSVYSASNFGGTQWFYMTFGNASHAANAYGDWHFLPGNGGGGGTPVLAVQGESGGNVGIGVAAPAQKLDVEGSVYIGTGGMIGVGTSSPRAALEVDGVIYGTNIGVNSTAPQARLDVDGVIYAHQNIGIATTGPRALLEVGTAANVTAGSNAAAIIKNDLVVDGKIYGDGSGLTSVPGSISGLTSTRVPVANSSNTLIDSVIYNVGDNIGIGTSAPAAKLDITVTGTAGVDALTIRDNTGTAHFTVLDNGNVGIGTTSPNDRLKVMGNFEVSDPSAYKAYRFRTDGGALDFDAGGTQMYYSVYSGSNFTGTQWYYLILRADSHVAQAYGDWKFLPGGGGGGTPALAVMGSSTGNIGIGTPAPAQKLDVEGSVYIGYGGMIGVGTVSPRTALEVDGIVYGTNIGINSTAPRALLEVGTAASVTAGSNAAAIIKNDLVVDGKIYGDGSGLTNVSGGISGLTGTTTYGMVPRASGASTLVDSAIYQDQNGNVSIGTTAPWAIFDVDFGTAAAGLNGGDIFIKGQNAAAGGHAGGSIYLDGGIGTSSWPNGSVAINNVKEFTVGRHGSDGYIPVASWLPANTVMINGWSVDDNTAFNVYWVKNTASINQYAYFGAVSVTGAANYTPALVWGQSIGANSYIERMRIDENGNFGVGTVAPQQKFEVEGNVYFGSGNVGINTAGARALLEVGNAASVTAGSNAAAIIKNDLVVDGKIYGDGSALTNIPAAISGLTGMTTYGMLPRASSSTTVVDSSVYQDANGNVGIGTTAPVQQLDLTRSIELVDTVSDSTGIIYKNGAAFLHNYAAPSSGGGNLFLGKYAGNFSMAAGAAHNVGTGDLVFQNLTTGFDNTAMGHSALRGNQDGYRNVAVGLSALSSNVSGIENVAVGVGALSNNADSLNTAVGFSALGENTTGTENSALGLQALGLSVTGRDNVAFGYQAGYGVVTASNVSYNVFLGANAGKAVLTGANNNLMAGYAAGDHVTTGAGNILLGYQAGNAITTGSNNILLGYDIDAQSNTASNQLSIGNLIFAAGGFGTGTAIGTGSIGIATTAPRGTLEVDGTTYLMSGNVGVGTTGPRALFEVGTAASITAGANAGAIIKNDLVVDGKIYGDGSGLTGVSGAITGLNTTHIPVANSSNTIIDSVIYNVGISVGIGTSAPRAILDLGSDGALLAAGTFGSGWTEPDLGGGTRMLWYPAKAAFRAGFVPGNQWNDNHIGDYSFAVGYDTYATNTGSMALGYMTTAGGNSSTAMGYSTNASGNFSTALGMQTTAESFEQTSVGAFNLPQGSESAGSWVTTEPLFVIGNGTGTGANRSTAVMVLKNGNVGVSTVAPQQKLDVEGNVYFGAGNVGINTTGTRALLEVGNAASLTAGSNAGAIIKNDLVVDGKIYGDGSGLTNVSGAISALNATRVPVASGPSTIVDSVIYNVGNNVGIGTTGPRANLEVGTAAGVTAGSNAGAIIKNDMVVDGNVYGTEYHLGANAVIQYNSSTSSIDFVIN